MKPIRVVDAPTLRGKIGMVMGSITADLLVNQFVIPHRNFAAKTGYQRDTSVSRVNKLAADLERGAVDLPTAVLLSLRDFDKERDVSERNGEKMFHPSGKLYVVDGQHRIEALKRLFEKSPEKWGGYSIPFICMLGPDERDEMEQFYVVNSTAKSVRTDLAFDLLKQRAESDAGVMTRLIEKQESWKVKSQGLVEGLERRSPAWRARVRFPGQDKVDTVINNSGLAASLKQLLDTPYFGAITQENQLQILDAYWKAVQQLIPDAFELPLDFALQKSSPGAWVMHGLLISVLEYIRSRGRSVVEAASYQEALEDVFDRLEGQNTDGEPVTGADFWRSGANGAAGQFSSHGGRRVLLSRMRALLPQIEVG